jgi:hypothetical protein
MAIRIDDKAITANEQVLNAVYRIMLIGIQNANYQNKPNYMGFSMMDEQRMQIKPNKKWFRGYASNDDK